MAVCRVEKNKNYTTMSNYHLRDKNLSNKACGLLSKMLSLPDAWDYTTRGLAAICKDGVDAITAQLKELEACGYLCRHRLRDSKGRITDVEYIIYEQPHLRPPDPEYPHTENPDMGEPDQGKPSTEKPAQIKKEENKYRRKSNTDGIKYPSISPDWMEERRTYEAIIKDNLDFDLLCEDNRYEQERLQEIVDIMLDAICSQSPTIRINGEDMPQQVVKSRFLKLTSMHIEYVFDAMRDNPSDIRNIRAYLLTTLYNAALTIDNYYSAKVNHDLYGVPDSSGTPFFHAQRKEESP